jgi:putative two-component system response regulator
MEQQAYQHAKFLIVDDELANIRLLEHLLDEWGCHNIESTTNPLQALPLFLGQQPDIVLLDLMMPALDGFGVMEQLQKVIPTHAYLPILVLTADVTPQAKRKALSLGAKDFVTKPFDAIELSLRIQNLLHSRFLHLQLQEQNHELEERVQERTQRLEVAELETIECLAIAAEYRDDDTGHHAQRVGVVAARLARHIGLEPEKAELIQRAAPLHDVGKIGISDSILLKPGKLTAEEFEVMKSHSLIGHQILSRHPS